jgi:hypothetical protein
MDFEAVQGRLGASPRLGGPDRIKQHTPEVGADRAKRALEVCQALAVGESEPGLTSTLVF